MDWHKIILTNAQVMSGELEKVSDLFGKLWATMHAPNTAAIFTADDVPGNCIIYFSPDASALASSLIKTYGGSPSTKPDNKGIRLLVGHHNVESKLLP